MVRQTALDLALVALVCAASFGCKSSGSSPASSVKDLGLGRCVAVNEAGQVLGIDESNEANATFVVDTNGSRRTLGAFEPGAMAIGLAIAENGDVVGYSESLAGRRAIRYSAGSWKAVDGVSAPWSVALGLGSKGETLGLVGTATPGETHAFLSMSGSLGPLALPGGPSSAAYLVNAEGRIAGIMQASDNETHAFLLSAGQLQDLGTLGGKNSSPYGMNGKGDVVGSSDTAGGPQHAFLWSGGGPLVDLGVPFGMVGSDARAIDDKGRIAGNGYDATGLSHPFLFVPGAAPAEIMPMDKTSRRFIGARILAASASGKMVGWGLPDTRGEGKAHCLVWTQGG